MDRDLKVSDGAHVKMPNADVGISDVSLRSLLDTAYKTVRYILDWAHDNPELFILTLVFLAFWIWAKRLISRDRVMMSREISEQSELSGHSADSTPGISKPTRPAGPLRLPPMSGEATPQQLPPPRKRNSEEGHV